MRVVVKPYPWSISEYSKVVFFLIRCVFNQSSYSVRNVIVRNACAKRT